MTAWPSAQSPLEAEVGGTSGDLLHGVTLGEGSPVLPPNGTIRPRHLLIRPALQSHIPGSHAAPSSPPALRPPELTCLIFLEFHHPSSREREPPGKPTPRSSEGNTKASRSPQDKSNSASSPGSWEHNPFFLWSVATHSAQDNVSFSTWLPSLWKVRRRKRGPPGSYFKLGLRDVVGGWRGPGGASPIREKGGPGSRRRGCLRED